MLGAIVSAMTRSDASQKFTQAQQNSLHGRILSSFAKGSGPGYVSLQEEDHNLSLENSLGESQASGLAKFFAANLKANLASPPPNATAPTVKAPTPQRGTITKANPVLSSVTPNSNPVLVRSQLNSKANVIKAQQAQSQELTSAFAPHSLDHFAKDSLSQISKTEQNNVSLESLGPLVSLHARLLQEYYYLNFTRYDAVISDMHLNGQHLPLVLVNPHYGVLIVQLCSESFEQLVKNPQLIHNHKKHSLQLREQFVKHFAEPHNEFSYQDLKHVTYVLQCYEKLSAQEVVKLFPAHSILGAKGQINKSNVFTRWPVAGMVQRLHAHIERNFADPNAGNKIQPAMKWLCHAAQVAFYLHHEVGQVSLFNSLEIPVLDRAQKEIMAIIKHRAQLRGQYSKFARPEAQLVLHPRQVNVELVGNTKPKEKNSITINHNSRSNNPGVVVTRRVLDGTVVPKPQVNTAALSKKANLETVRLSPAKAPVVPVARSTVRINTERAREQAHKAAQILKRAPQKISQQIAARAAEATPMMMVGTLDFE